jgi:enoyl-CoA hydratase/carnithine racemase
MNGAIALAEEIAARSPVAVQLTKKTLVHARNHTTQEGLDFIVSAHGLGSFWGSSLSTCNLRMLLIFL